VIVLNDPPDRRLDDAVPQAVRVEIHGRTGGYRVWAGGHVRYQTVGRCRFKPVEPRVESTGGRAKAWCLRFQSEASLSLSISPRVERARLQRLKLKCHEPLLDFAFKYNLRRYETEEAYGRGGEYRGSQVSESSWRFDWL